MLLDNCDKGRNELWRYVTGVFVVLACYVLGQLPLLAAMKLSGRTIQELEIFESTMDFNIIGVHKNIGFILLICMFVTASIGFYIVLKYIHQKNLQDMVTFERKINFSKVLFGFTLWFALMIVIEAIHFFIDPNNYILQFNGLAFLPLLLICLFLLPIQTSFEEFFFRGYIMQGAAFFSRRPWLSMVVSSVLFGLVHGTNPEVARYGFWTMQFFYILAGLILAYITILDDGLELALGIHAAINIGGALLVTYKGSVIQTDAIFMVQSINPIDMIVSLILTTLIFIGVCYKKYQWNRFDFIFRKIQQKNELEQVSNI